MCAFPKGFKKDIKLVKPKVGVARRQEILDDIADQGTFLPRGVLIEDMDNSFIEFVNNDSSITLDGEKVPVIFLNIQGWAEFERTWQFSDKYKNIQIPFITIVRKPDVQQGTNQGGLWNIPGIDTYTYMKVPSFDGIRTGIDVYKIPQPTSVDINYEVRFFCNKMRDLNVLNQKIQKLFKSKQYYIRVNGHPMPIHLETIGDESQIDDIENRRFYVQLYEMKLLGYILDEDDFEVIPSVNRMMVMTEVTETKLKPMLRVNPDKFNNTISFNVIIKPFAETSFTTISEFDMRFTEIVNQENVGSIAISVNGVLQTLPFVVNAGQTIGISVTKDGFQTTKFTIRGELI